MTTNRRDFLRLTAATTVALGLGCNGTKPPTPEPSDKKTATTALKQFHVIFYGPWVFEIRKDDILATTPDSIIADHNYFAGACDPPMLKMPPTMPTGHFQLSGVQAGTRPGANPLNLHVSVKDFGSPQKQQRSFTLPHPQCHAPAYTVDVKGKKIVKGPSSKKIKLPNGVSTAQIFSYEVKDGKMPQFDGLSQPTPHPGTPGVALFHIVAEQKHHEDNSNVQAKHVFKAMTLLIPKLDLDLDVPNTGVPNQSVLSIKPCLGAYPTDKELIPHRDAPNFQAAVFGGPIVNCDAPAIIAD